MCETPWTPCGMRCSRTVESQRKTCIAKHSGKCHFKLFLPALNLCSCSFRRFLTPEGFLITPCDLGGVLFTIYTHLSFLCFLLFDAIFLPDFFPVPFDQKRSPPATAKPLLCLSFCFSPGQLALTDWGQSKRWRCFNFIDLLQRCKSPKLSPNVTRSLPQRRVRVGFK